jgi:hypothetical protein
MVLRYAHPMQAHRTAALEKLVRHNAQKEKAERLAAPDPKLLRRKSR